MSKKQTTKKTAMIRARTTAGLKTQAERVFHQLGISSTEAINLFYAQVCLRRGMPFAVDIPNDETMKVFEKTERGEELIHNEDVDEMLAKLGI